jgi:hypothetical protein
MLCCYAAMLCCHTHTHRCCHLVSDDDESHSAPLADLTAAGSSSTSRLNTTTRKSTEMRLSDRSGSGTSPRDSFGATATGGGAGGGGGNNLSIESPDQDTTIQYE